MKKHRLLVGTAALVIGCLGLCLAGCDAASPSPAETARSESIPSGTTAAEPEIKTIYRVEYETVRFLPNAAKEAWREPLLALLSNESEWHFDKNGDGGQSCPYPDRPSVEKGDSVSLFDINTDGTPELLIDMGGGSAGNACYFVYDLVSGEKRGTINGGHGDDFCLYFNTETGRFETIAQYGWRGGWAGRSTFVRRIRLTEAMDSPDPLLVEESLMEAYYRLDAALCELTPEEEAAGVRAGWDEVCVGATFSVGGNSVGVDGYLDARETFVRVRTRIPETGMQTLRRNDYGDDIERLVDDLLALDQSYVQPTPIKPTETED